MLDPTLDFFDAVLAGRRSDIPPVHYETCGGETRTATTWPPEGARETSLYLGRAQGGLVLADEPGGESTVSWQHDPEHPVPSDAANPFARLADRRDLSEVAARSDVLTFVGPAVDDAVDFTAARSASRSVLRSSVGTTNLHTRLLDLAPDGTQLLVAKGQVHLPEVPYGAGHRRPVLDLLPAAGRPPLGLQLMSSDFPEYVLEPGDGSDPWEAETFAPSEQTVQLGARAARLILTTT